MDILWIKILEIMDMAWIWSQFLDEMDYEPISNHSCCNTAPCTSKPLHNIKYDILSSSQSSTQRINPFAKRLR